MNAFSITVHDAVTTYHPLQYFKEGETEYPNTSPIDIFGEWGKYINEALLNDYESALIDELQEEYKRDGSFREPIRLESSENKRIYVGNGHHRLVAAYLLNKNNKVSLFNEWTDKNEYYDSVFRVDAYIDFTHPNILEDDDMFMLRSLKLSDEFWAESDSASSSMGGPLCVRYMINTDDLDLLTIAIEKRINKFGGKLTSLDFKQE